MDATDPGDFSLPRRPMRTLDTDLRPHWLHVNQAEGVEPHAELQYLPYLLLVPLRPKPAGGVGAWIPGAYQRDDIFFLNY